MLMNLFQLDSFNKRYFLQFLTLLLIPLIFSLFLYFVPGKNNSNTKITTYIPSNKNITNYQKTKKLYFDLEKFNTTELIVCPEVFLKPINIYSNSQQNQLTFLDKLLNKKQNTNLVFGVELKTNSTLFNSIFIKNQEESLYRIKQKFVPLREFTPKLFEKTFNIPSYYSKNKNDFTEKIKKKYGFIPIICYESIFSIFIAKNSSNSDFILLSTSEQFLNNSYFGKKQYLDIVRLRTIENGRYIVKCSNQGISCVINEKGRIVKSITKEIENIKVQRINKNTIYQSLISFFLHVRNC
ncbi:MAG: nitrilase-related carbon-nitrogen hydrolase [Algibacter sp.]